MAVFGCNLMVLPKVVLYSSRIFFFLQKIKDGNQVGDYMKATILQMKYDEETDRYSKFFFCFHCPVTVASTIAIHARPAIQIAFHHNQTSL